MRPCLYAPDWQRAAASRRKCPPPTSHGLLRNTASRALLDKMKAVIDDLAEFEGFLRPENLSSALGQQASSDQRDIFVARAGYCLRQSTGRPVALPPDSQCRYWMVEKFRKAANSADNGQATPWADRQTDLETTQEVSAAFPNG
jgi:hypothetical protein